MSEDTITETTKETKSMQNLSSSELEGSVEHCIANLKIISKIKSKDKLYFKGGDDNKFYIDEPQWGQGVARWWYEGSRKQTLDSLDKFVVKVFATIDAIYNKENNNNASDISNTYYSSVTGSRVFKEENSNLLIQFTQEMSNAISGLGNLKSTYKNDITTVSNIEIIIEKMNVRVKKIAGLLKINNSSN